MATTISLWASRRLPRVRRPWRALLLPAICVLVLSAAAAGVVRFTGTSARVASPGRSHQGQVRAGAAAGATADAGDFGHFGDVGSVRFQAAAWVAGQVSSDVTIACDPLMCAALRARGLATSRLLPLEPTASGATGAGVVVASPSARTQDSSALLASFGTGASLIEVRATAPGGASAYQPALQADLAARRSAGAQLLHSRRIEVSAQGAGQLEAGEVDSRLLIMLTMLASQHPWRVVAFGDASPGVPFAEAPFRQVVIASANGRDGAAGLAAALALVRAQRAPYQAAQVTTVRLAGGQAGLRIDFAAPSPLGLLTGGARG